MHGRWCSQRRSLKWSICRLCWRMKVRVESAPSQGEHKASPNRRQVKDCRNWPRPASRATARVAPTIHERNAQPCIVGAGLAPALGAARDAAIDPILEFLHLTPIGRPQGSPLPCYAGLGLHASSFDGCKQSCMVAFRLVRIGLGKVGNGLVEHIAVAQVAADK